MGKIFNSSCCSTCTNNEGTGNVDMFGGDQVPVEHLEDYQNFDIKNEDLKDKYDKIHRV